MKKNIFILLLFVSLSSFAQTEKMALQISSQGTTVRASVDGGNENVKLTLSTKKDGRLVIMNANAKNETKLTRRYMLMTSVDEDLQLNFMSRVNGITNALLKDIFAKTSVGKTYMLYSIATPSDPNEAAAVRVKRVLLCKVIIK